MTMSIIWDYVVDRRGRGVTALQTKKKHPLSKMTEGVFLTHSLLLACQRVLG